MTWKPMDPNDETSLHDSSSGLGQAILAVHGGTSISKPLDDASVAAASDAGFMADVEKAGIKIL